jgi:hypothetical protein
VNGQHQNRARRDPRSNNPHAEALPVGFGMACNNGNHDQHRACAKSGASERGIGIRDRHRLRWRIERERRACDGGEKPSQ